MFHIYSIGNNKNFPPIIALILTGTNSLHVRRQHFEKVQLSTLPHSTEVLVPDSEIPEQEQTFLGAAHVYKF